MTRCMYERVAEISRRTQSLDGAMVYVLEAEGLDSGGPEKRGQVAHWRKNRRHESLWSKHMGKDQVMREFWRQN